MNASPALDADSMKIGLLLETAETQQRLIASELTRLQAHTDGLDEIVRDQIRRTLTEELATVVEEAARVASALRWLERAARLRNAAWAVATVGLGAVATGLSAWWLLPTPAEMSTLRSKREQLRSEVAILEQQGARIDLRRCGDDQRWCVRVERQGPVFGRQADYLIVKGY